MADPVSLSALAFAAGTGPLVTSTAAAGAGAGVGMLGTIVGAAGSALGALFGGQRESAMYKYQAGVNQQLAQIAARNAIWDIQAGEVKAQQAGLISRAAAGRLIAGAGARNIGPTTGSTAQAYQSQLAIGQENQAVQRADAAHAAYGEQVQAAEKTATAGADVFAAQTATTAGDIKALGSIASGVGSVAGKWYDVQQYGGPTGFGSGGVNVNTNLPTQLTSSGPTGTSTWYEQ